MIYTFYSFKGGVGRSMALANVADRLARRGLRVLAIDFDLEAPGLERYYPIDKDAALANPGLIDLLRAFKDSLAGRGESLEAGAFRELARFVLPIYERVGEGGRLDLLSAGCRSPGEGLRRYALEVRTFDWQDFYYNWEGEAFFEWLRRELTGPQGRYDAVLVDSRTGVTEMGGVCAYQLADVVVMMSAANHQNLQGTLDVARDFCSAPVMALRHGRPLELLVVPARIEQRDPALLKAFYRRFQETFEGQIPAQLAGVSAESLAIPYEPEYAFEEVVVTDPARRERLASIGAAYECLADALVMLGDGAMLRLQPAARAALWPAHPAQGDDAAAAPPAQGAETTLRYDPTRRFADYDAFISRGSVAPLAEALEQALRRCGLRVYLDNSALVPGESWSQATALALHHSRHLLLCLDAGGLSPWQKREVEQARSAAQAVHVLPVLLPGAEPELLALALRGMADLQPVDLRAWPERQLEFDLLVQQLQQRVGAEAAAAPNASLFNPYAGLAPGGEAHAGLLDLPEAALQALLEGLRSRHAMHLLGPSGVGKTTLVAAGLVKAVRDGALGQPVPELRWIDARAEPGWPLQLRAPAADAAPQLCIVDHADEVPAGLRARDDAQSQRSAWLAEIGRLLAGANARWRILVIARYGLPALAERSVELPAAAVPPLRPRLDVPALRTGMAFEPGLLERLEADLQLGCEPLSLGQLLLPGLWDGARHGFLANESYAARGGVPAVYAAHVDAVLARTPPALQARVQGLLLWLLQASGESAWAWRSGSWQRLSQLRGHDGAAPQALFWLVRERVLHLEQRDGELQLQLLWPLPPAACPALQRLLDEHGPQLRLRGALAFAQERWQRAGRDPASLLTGQALRDAQGLVDDWDAHLTQDMVDYVQASQQSLLEAGRQAAVQAQAQRRRRRHALVTVLVAALGVGGFVWTRGRSHDAELAQTTQRAAERVQESKTEGARAAVAIAQVTSDGSARQAAESLRGRRVAIQYSGACELGLMNTLATALTALGANVDAPQYVETPLPGELRYTSGHQVARDLQTVLGDLLGSMGLSFRPALKELPGERASPLLLALPELSRLSNPRSGEAREGRDGNTLLLVPAGCATLGSERAARELLMRSLGVRYISLFDNDKPLTHRWLDAFYVQRTEVTNAQFGRYVAQACADGTAMAACPGGWRARGAPDEPARYLGWQAADAYCRWLGGRLPSEEEWEKAARGVDGRQWPWGNEPDAKRFHGERNARRLLAAVASYPAGASPYGAADMAGNLWELTASPWGETAHVMKGGSYLNDLAEARASLRWSSSDEARGADYLGFRCVVDYRSLR